MTDIVAFDDGDGDGTLDLGDHIDLRGRSARIVEIDDSAGKALVEFEENGYRCQAWLPIDVLIGPVAPRIDA